jgi:hypothetical protein
MEPSTLDGAGRADSSADRVGPASERTNGRTGDVLIAPADPEPAIGAPPDSGPGVRTVRGTRLIAVVSVIVVVTFIFNLVMAERNKSNNTQRAASVVTVNDTNMTKQTWTNLDDGLTAQFVSVDNNPDTVERIRELLKFRRTEYLRANYSDPRFGNAQIAGRADLEFGTTKMKLNCRYRDIPGGGELRWITTDPVMLDSLKEWAGVVAVPSAD